MKHIHITQCTHHAEWEAAKNMRQKYFFEPLSMQDPYTWTFEHPEHVHFILYKGADMIGYAHIQLWPHRRAALRIIVIDETSRGHGFGSQFLQLCEQWLKKQGIISLHDEARPDAVAFYRKSGYIEMPFEDPSGEPPSPHDIAIPTSGYLIYLFLRAWQRAFPPIFPQQSKEKSLYRQ